MASASNSESEMPDALLPFAARLFSRFPEVLLALGQPNLLKDFPSSCFMIEERGEYKLVQVLLERRGCRSSAVKSLQRRGVMLGSDGASRMSRGAAAVVANTASVKSAPCASHTISSATHANAAEPGSSLTRPSNTGYVIPPRSRERGPGLRQPSGSPMSVSSPSSASEFASSGLRSHLSAVAPWNAKTYADPKPCPTEEQRPSGFSLSNQGGPAAAQELAKGGHATVAKRPSLGSVFRSAAREDTTDCIGEHMDPRQHRVARDQSPEPTPEVTHPPRPSQSPIQSSHPSRPNIASQLLAERPDLGDSDSCGSGRASKSFGDGASDTGPAVRTLAEVAVVGPGGPPGAEDHKEILEKGAPEKGAPQRAPEQGAPKEVPERLSKKESFRRPSGPSAVPPGGRARGCTYEPESPRSPGSYRPWGK